MKETACPRCYCILNQEGGNYYPICSGLMAPLPLPCIILNTNRRIKTGKAWERDYIHIHHFLVAETEFLAESRNMSFRVCNWLRNVHILTNLPASIVWPPQDLNMSLHVQQVFPDFSFWLLAVCKNEGRRPGRFSHVNDANVYLGKTEGGEGGRVGGGDPQSKDRAWGLTVHWGFGPKHLNFKRSWNKWTAPCSRLRECMCEMCSFN